MKQVREVIEIDENLCNGCGQCILSCAEAALEIVDGKAKLIGDIYCDGLGACLGECPEGALTIINREAENFDEAAVEELLEKAKSHKVATTAAPSQSAPCGCPGTMAQSFTHDAAPVSDEQPPALSSQLTHWPIKLQLLGPQAPFLDNADLVLMADCTGFSFPSLHQKILPGSAIAIGCPKLDDLDAHIDRLTEILANAKPKSLTVVHMEVPCCRGFVYAAQKAIEQSGADLPLRRMMIGVNGELLEEEN